MPESRMQRQAQLRTVKELKDSENQLFRWSQVHLGPVYMYPLRLSFRNDFIHPIYFTVSVYMIPRRNSSLSGMSSFRNEIFVLE